MEFLRKKLGNYEIGQTVAEIGYFKIKEAKNENNEKFSLFGSGLARNG